MSILRHRTAVTLCVALFVASACGEREPTAIHHPPPPPPPPGDEWTVRVPTYEHSGQTVHPDYAASPDWWQGAAEYLAITPYPNGDAGKENPSVFVGGDASGWSVPTGAPNPVRLPQRGYLSDPDILFDSDAHELRLYFRQVDEANVIQMVRSSDGAHWTDPVTVVQAPNHLIVSPAVVRRGTGDWLMWSVNSGYAGCSAASTTVELRRSTDGIHWSAPETVAMPSMVAGFSPWHIDVQWVPARGEYWALYNAKTPGECGTTVLFLATSRDGVSWTTRPQPLMVAGDAPELRDIVYRGTFLYDGDNDAMTIWVSGARREDNRWVWSTIGRRLSLSDLDATGPARSTAALMALRPSAHLESPP